MEDLELETNRILIIGGGGFLGSRLSLFLSSINNFEIFVASRNCPKTLLENTTKITYRHCDLLNYSSLKRALIGIDTLIHLAVKDQNYFQKFQHQAIHENEKSSDNLVQAIKSSKVKSLIYFSTSQIYGSTLEGLIDEDTIPSPSNLYSISHFQNEGKFSNLSGIQTAVLRLSNAFGNPIEENENFSKLALNNFLTQAFLERKISIINPYAYKDFIPIKNIEKALFFLISQKNYGIFNLGYGQSFSILEISNLIIKKIKHKFGLVISLKLSDNAREHPKFEYSLKKINRHITFDSSAFDQELDSLINFFHNKKIEKY